MTEPLFLDTETKTFSPGNMAPDIVCYSYTNNYLPQSFGTSKLGVLHHNDVSEDTLREMLSGHLVGHAFDYDTVCICAAFPYADFIDEVFEAYARGRIQCTLIREQLLQIWRGNFQGNQEGAYALATLYERYTKKHLEKEDTYRLRYGELYNVPMNDWPQEAIDYSQMDAIATEAVYRAQDAVVKYHGGDPDEIFFNAPEQAANAFALRLMTVWGIVTDAQRVRMAETHVTLRQNELRKYLLQSGLLKPKKDGYSRNLKRIRELLIEENGDDVVYTEKGNVSTARDVLESKNDDGDFKNKDLQRVAEYVSLEKLLNTYIKILKEGVNTPIHAYFGLLETGRRGASKNMQTPPRKAAKISVGEYVENGKKLFKNTYIVDIRSCYVPRPGYYYVSNDYNSVELRTWSQCLVDLFGIDAVPMAQMYQKDPDADPHTKFGAEVFLKISYEEGLALVKSAGEAKKEGRKLTELEQRMKDARQGAKAANFGLPGGLGAEKFVNFAEKTYGYKITPDEGKHIKKNWLKVWNAKPYFDFIADKVETLGYIIQHRSNRFRGRIDFCAASNSPFQGLAADGTYHAVFLVARDCYANPKSVLFGSRIVNVLHDEIIIEVPIKNASKAAKRLEEIQNQAMSRFCPDVPIISSPSMMTAWYKDAPAIYKNGELIPYEGEK